MESFERKTVSEIVEELHGNSIRPHAKGECPFCGHKTFAIKGDDTIGKCFHPSCGRVVTPARQENACHKALHDFLENFFKDSHSALLELGEKSEERNAYTAYTYLVTERNIHPQVVADSMLGVVPSDYDIEAKFKPFLEVAEAAAMAEAEKQKGKRGRPRKSYAEDGIQFLKNSLEKLTSCLRSGWLCFFYTDAAHRITSIRFRKPYTKNILYFKPYKRAGLFGHGLFSEQQHFDYLFVMEGEFNQLQLQSLALRWSEAAGLEPTYVNACAVGGVLNADYETIAQLTDYPVICYDNDENGAGFDLVKRAQETMKVRAFTTPVVGSDLDQYIRGFGKNVENYVEAWVDFIGLISYLQAYPRSFEGVKGAVASVRGKRGERDARREHEIHADVAQIVISDMNERGEFFHDKAGAYYFLREETKLIKLVHEGRECQLLLDRYGLNSTEKIYRYVNAQIGTTAFSKGAEITAHRLAYYNTKKYTVYLTNFGGKIYRISPDRITVVPNGTDGVLFLTDGKAKPFDILDVPSSSGLADLLRAYACGKDTHIREVIDPFILEAIALFDGEIVDSEGNPSPEGVTNCTSVIDYALISRINFSKDNLSPNEKRMVFILWLLSIFFESIFPTKPIMALIGEKGSGKSIIARMVGLLMFGEGFNVVPLSNDPSDFDAAVTNSLYVAFDNCDSPSPWLNDRLALVATGGNIAKRSLYTTNELVDIPVKCFLALTAHSPQFTREDVAERLLIMNVRRLERFLPEHEILTEILRLRNLLMREVVGYIQEITRALKGWTGPSEGSRFRVADFADFALKVAQYAGVEAEMKVVFRKLSSEQSSFALDDEPLVELLREWAAANPNAEVTNAELCTALGALAGVNGAHFAYKTPRAFGQKMKNLRSNLTEFFDINERPAGGHKKLYTYAIKQRET